MVKGFCGRRLVQSKASVSEALYGRRLVRSAACAVGGLYDRGREVRSNASAVKGCVIEGLYDRRRDE